ncbi:MAG: arylsulfatase A-like enzyme [Patiriisocius sp.]|jgi:arylsulfatase A-like enzyme
MTKMNLLLITADQWRGDCLSAVNHPVVKTPNLDRIAAEGILFTNHYANAVPCGPSRACLHTGMYLHNHRSATNGTPLDSRFTNWAKELRQKGYDPVLFGYTHTAQDPRDIDSHDPRLNTDEGILPGIRPIIDMATHCPDWRDYLRGKGYQLPEQDGATYGVKGEPVALGTPAPTQYQAEDSDTAFLTDGLMSYVEGQPDAWAAHLSLRAPHPPWVATAPYHEQYDTEELPDYLRHASREDEQKVHPWLSAHLDVVRNGSHADPDRHRLLHASYYGLMSEVDHHMGRLVQFLKDRGEWENTLFIFTSDHGEQMGDHWMYGKAGYYDQSYHIPLIISGPGLSSGCCDAFTEHVDITPTILELLGQSIPRQCDGHSLKNWLTKMFDSNWRDSVHFEYDFRHSEAESTLDLDMESACLNVVRDHHYKYVHFADLPALLFDLKNDPAELHNLAESEPKLVAKYAGKLLSWRLATTEKSLSHFQIVREAGLINKLAAT